MDGAFPILPLAPFLWPFMLFFFCLHGARRAAQSELPPAIASTVVITMPAAESRLCARAQANTQQEGHAQDEAA